MLRNTDVVATWYTTSSPAELEWRLQAWCIARAKAPGPQRQQAPAAEASAAAAEPPGGQGLEEGELPGGPASGQAVEPAPLQLQDLVGCYGQVPRVLACWAGPATVRRSGPLPLHRLGGRLASVGGAALGHTQLWLRPGAAAWRQALLSLPCVPPACAGCGAAEAAAAGGPPALAGAERRGAGLPGAAACARGLRCDAPSGHQAPSSIGPHLHACVPGCPLTRPGLPGCCTQCRPGGALRVRPQGHQKQLSQPNRVLHVREQAGGGRGNNSQPSRASKST